MTYEDFVKECLDPPINDLEFGYWLENFERELVNESAAGVARKISRENLTTVTAAINKCLKHIKVKAERVPSTASSSTFKNFKTNLNILSKELDDVLKANTVSAESDPRTLLDSYSKKIDDLKSQLDALSVSTANQLNNADSKLFSTIINMVAILGIFVAIAYAGFGSVSLASAVKLDIANEFIKSTFFICLIGLLIYNFLLLLVYFVMKVVNSNLFFSYISVRKKLIPNNKIFNGFLITCDLTLLIITILLFIASLKI